MRQQCAQDPLPPRRRDLQPLLQRFRAWMVNIYKSLKALNVELTPEVRGVMDRMLATTQQIKEAEAARKAALAGTTDPKAARKAEREAARQARYEAQQGLRSGDPRKLPARDQGPIKARVRDIVGGFGADLVMDCSGHPSAGPEGIEMLRDGGTYVEMGQFTDAGSIAVTRSMGTKMRLRVNISMTRPSTRGGCLPIRMVSTTSRTRPIDSPSGPRTTRPASRWRRAWATSSACWASNTWVISEPLPNSCTRPVTGSARLLC